ncbi:PKD domain-containing protein [candidate division KSB1 bacterium]|nr:PKD domain-containing protein [candidate division KSB1 bacterium]
MYRMFRNLIRLQFILLLLVSSAMPDWREAIEIYQGAESPDIAVDRNTGYVHLVFYKPKNSGLIYTKTDPDGKILIQEPVPGAENDGGAYRFSGTIAVDVQGRPHVTFRIHIKDNAYDAFYTYRNDNGTWAAPLQLFSSIPRGNQLRMTSDDNNRIHIIYPEWIKDAYAQISYIQIHNGGIITSAPRLTGIYEHTINDHIEIDASRTGDIYMILGCPVKAKETMVFRSQNAGNTWQAGVDIRTSGVSNVNTACGSPDVFVDEQGVSHFCFGTDRDPDATYTPSVRYVRMVNGEIQRNTVVTGSNELKAWKLGVGHGSIATSDDGKYVMIIYSNPPGGQLRYRISEDFGAKFSYANELSPLAGGIEEAYDGRDKAKVRGYMKRFYATYDRSGSVYLRIYAIPGFNPPKANAGGPYTGKEGQEVNFSASGSTDDIGIDKYEWDWDNNGTWDESSTSPNAKHKFEDEYSGTIKLRVTDRTNLTAVAEAQVTITNLAPTVEIGGSVTGKEGTPVSLSITVTDPGIKDTHTYLWNFGDGTTGTEKNPSHAFTDNGTFTVKCEVTDNGGAKATAQTTATISNENPTANAGGPYNTQVKTPVTLTGSGTDPAGANDPLTFEWDLNNDGNYDLNGKSAQATFNAPGTQIIKLRVRDDDGGEALAQATVNIGTVGPVFTAIPPQVVNEGTDFPILDLDNYVEDLDTPDAQLTFTYTGQESLEVDFNFSTHEVQVSVPYDEWAGTEKITFEAQDPDQHKAQTTVTFTVKPVNDPPKLTNLSDRFIDEDDTTMIYRSELDQLVTDPDTPKSKLTYSIANNLNTQWVYDSRISALLIYPKQNWSGKEVLTLKVSDGSGSDSKDFTIWVAAKPDPPLPFTLLSPLNENFKMWPASLTFKWNNATDPDQNDKVTYRWVLSRFENFQTILDQSTYLTTNTYTYTNQSGKNPGMYFWRVEAKDNDGQKTYSTDYGVLNLNSKAPYIRQIPDQTINEGNTFQTINLDSYVSDEDNQPDQLSWRYIGNKDLMVQISTSRVATITIPHKKWFGQEQITFIVTDPTALSDSSTVTFTVRDVNAKPVLKQVPNQNFDEDTQKILTRSFLENLTSDEDNVRSEFRYKLVDNVNIKFSIAANGDMLLFTEPDWCGEEITIMVVEDGAGAADSSIFKITVNPVPDPPQPFELVSPNASSLFTWLWPMRFTWQQVVDPDPNDQTFYYFILSRSATFADTLEAMVLPPGTTNSFDYMAPYKRKPKGTYYWSLAAFDMDGNFVMCKKPAHFSIMIDDVETVNTGEIPKEFALHQNHPNPFNPETQIRFGVPEQSYVNLTIYNSLGQKIRTLVDEEYAPGLYDVRWDACDENHNKVSSGIYIYQLKTEKQVMYRKMLLLQ